MVLNVHPDQPCEGAEEIASAWYETPTPTEEQVRKTRFRLAQGTLKARKIGNIYVATVRQIRAQKGVEMADAAA